MVVWCGSSRPLFAEVHGDGAVDDRPQPHEPRSLVSDGAPEAEDDQAVVLGHHLNGSLRDRDEGDAEDDGEDDGGDEHLNHDDALLQTFNAVTRTRRITSPSIGASPSGSDGERRGVDLRAPDRAIARRSRGYAGNPCRPLRTGASNRQASIPPSAPTHLMYPSTSSRRSVKLHKTGRGGTRPFARTR